ncbi:protein BTG3 [Caerostris darwini]|uniref:Protein BTG3 n=1 Tax=Caerostris darwini TaxID=1538125 RepID=A0AAV4S5B4_9ARAC|nr:protein BTG3 [Caerostris darwini]
MKEEIWAAVNFLTRLVSKYDGVNEDQVKEFQETLIEILTEKFKGHWFPEKPNKGQAYRCIRVNGNERKDPVLEKAAEKCGLQYENLHLPAELTVWVDPLEVCCRFGENEGSYCTVACFKDNKENCSNNVQSSHQNSPECQKKQKNRRKPLEKQKKTTTARNSTTQPTPSKGGFNPKAPLIHPKAAPCYLNNYFDWSPSGVPIPSSRYPRNNVSNFPDLPFLRRAKKPVRSIYPNDKYHWARK